MTKTMSSIRITVGNGGKLSAEVYEASRASKQRKSRCAQQESLQEQEVMILVVALVVPNG